MEVNEHDIIIRKQANTYHLLIPELGLVSTAEDLSQAYQDIIKKRSALLEAYQNISAEKLLQTRSNVLHPYTSWQNPASRFTIKSLVVAFLILWFLFLSMWFGSYFAGKTIDKAARVTKDSVKEVVNLTGNQNFWIEMRNNMRSSRKKNDPKSAEIREAKIEVLQMILADLQPYLNELEGSRKNRQESVSP